MGNPEAGFDDEDQAPEAAERGVGKELRALEAIAGPEQAPLPEEVSEKDLDAEEHRLIDDAKVESFSEQSRFNELQYRRGSLQQLATLKKDEKKLKPADKQRHTNELIIANQAITYHAYFPEIVRDMVATMSKYEELRAQTPVVSPELAQGEVEARIYMTELARALRERVAFSNVALLDRMLGKHIGDGNTLMQKRGVAVASRDLSIESKNVLSKDPSARAKHSNALDQHIINILAGTKVVPGVKQGFFPQKLYLDLLQEKYKQSFAEEKRVISDPSLTRSKARFEELKKRGTIKDPKLLDALDPAKKFLTPEEEREFRLLESQFGNREAHLKAAGASRHALAQEIVRISGRLGSDQIESAELATIQHQFGDKVDLMGATGANTGQTPEGLRKAVSEQMETRSNFHLGRMDAFLGEVKDEVLHVGIPEVAEHATQKVGLPLVRKANHALTSVITRLVPNVMGAREHAKGALNDPLDEALGWPPGKENWEDLTPKEQENVLKKSQSVLDIIESFDKKKIDNLQGTVSLVRSMPEASTFAGQDIKDIPTERVTEANRESLIATYGGGAVYVKLFQQMDEDWGSVEGKAGFLGEYASFIEKLNQNVDVHIDVGDAVFQLQNTYDNFKSQLFYAALLALGISLVGIVTLWKIGRPVASMAGRAAWGTTKFAGRTALKTVQLGGKVVVETTKAGVKVTKKTVEGLRNLAGEMRKATPKTPTVKPPVTPPPGAAKAAQAAEKTAEGASKASRMGRVLGPLGIILSAVDLRRVILRDARLDSVKELDGIEAGIELMELKGNKEAPRYKQEVEYLKNRLAALQMERNAQSMSATLEDNFPKENQKAAALKERWENVRKFARSHKNEFEKLFPITDYFVTDPEGAERNVGINIRNVDEARTRGVEYAQYKAMQSLPSLTEMTKPRVEPELLSKPKTDEERIPEEERAKLLAALERHEAGRPLEPEKEFADLQRVYETLLNDTLDFIEEQP